MSIVFFCQSCGARFEVDPRMAGKRGHCKKCGQIMTIPRAEEIASMSAIPALAMAGAGAEAGLAAGGGPAGAAVGKSFASLLRAGISGAGLAPITLDRMPIGYKRPTKPSPLDDAEDSKPYVLAQPVPDARGRAKRQDNAALNLWRRQIGAIQRVFRKIHQAAYLVSVPFLMILLLGIVVKNRQMALLAATAVVLLNIGRLVAGAANMAVVPLRDGVNAKKMKKPLGRVIEPALTILVVVLAFTFIPWLSSGNSAKGSVAQRIRSSSQALQKDMEGEVNQVLDKAKAIDVDRLGAQARETLEGLGDKAKEIDIQKVGAQAREKLGGSGSPPPSNEPPKRRLFGGIRSGVEALEKRTQEELDKAKALGDPQKQP
jgi:hypothetical protein